jgi:leader peptidase (prepilin peptidase) / N-methyltransferase
MRRRVLLSLLALPLVGLGILATGLRPELVAVVYLAAVTSWLVMFDVTTHRLPNVLVLPGIGVGLVSCAGEWIASGRPPMVPLVAGCAYAGFLLVLNLVGGMGMGDVKLAAALGFASWNVSVAVLSPVVAFLVGGLVSVVLLISGKRGQRIAFGPFLLGGFWVAVGLVALSRVY